MLSHRKMNFIVWSPGTPIFTAFASSRVGQICREMKKAIISILYIDLAFSTAAGSFYFQLYDFISRT